jgi:anti-sigma-K factor RskA
MTGPGHAEFEELAAGYVLDALEPADERRFLQHATGCPQCQQVLAGFGEVAAALADVAPPAEPSPQLGQRIMAVTQAGAETGGPGGTRPASPAPQPASPPPPVVPRRPRQPQRQRWVRWAAAVAAAAAIVAGGTWAGLAASSGGPPSPLAACAKPHACPQVPLVAADTHREAAKVIVLGREAWVQSVAMAPTPAGHIYVLWQLTAAHKPRAVGAFNIPAGGHGPIRVGNLAPSYPGTAGFAVSVERGRQIPAAPSKVVAAGRAS